MAALVEGSEYGLTSFMPTSVSKTAVHVKLTDSALKAIEEFQKIKGATSRRPIIQINGNQGVIKVPNEKSSQNPEGFRTFKFTLSNNPGDPKGSFDSVRQGDGKHSQSIKQLSLVGSMLHRINIHANEDSYANTKLRVSQVEEESKKSCAQEIELGGRYIGRKIKKVVKASNLPPSKPALTSRPSDLGFNSGSAVKSLDVGHTLKPSSGRPPSTPAQPAKPSIMHNKNANKGQGNKGHPYHSSSSQRASSGIGSMPLRDRIIHLLAVRPYKKPELLIRLSRDGIKDREKNTITSTLQQVAQYQRDNSYSLAKHLYNQVRQDWPFYTEADRLLLKRRMPEQLSSAGSSPALSLSPCHSNSSQGSPTNSQQKRPNSTDEYYPTKRQRVAHQDVHKSNGNLVNHSGSQLPSGSADELIPSPDRSLDKNSNSIDLKDSAQNPDYVRLYTAIKARDQRIKYKEEFNREYEEYRLLHTKVEKVVRRFLQMEQLLKKHPSGSQHYESMKHQIFDQYKLIKKNKDFQEQKKRCDYLHLKLGHIKKLILDYDKLHVQVSAS